MSLPGRPLSPGSIDEVREYVQSVPLNRVCYICYREHPGTVFDQFSRFVAEYGFDVTVVTYRTKDEKPFVECDGRKFLRIGLPTAPFAMRSKAAFVSAIVDFLNRNDFSIVHFHNSCDCFGIIKLLTSSKAIFVYHTTSHPVSQSSVRIAKRKAIDIVQCLLMNAVIIQSEELKDRLPGIRSLRRSVIIPVGYNGRLFYEVSDKSRGDMLSRIGCNSEAFILVYIGGMVRKRQLNKVVEGFARAKQVCKDIVLLMIGDGESLTEFQALSGALGVENDIIFTGQVPHENIIEYLAAADIGVSFVPINESYNYNPPLKTFEYLACGLPVIATRTVSNSKIVTDGLNGILIEDTAESLSQAILDVVRNRGKWDRMRMNASRSVVDFDFEKITRNLLIPLYNRLLGIDR
jgi:glycosyltransferase involved in cell wall biosynthesis